MRDVNYGWLLRYLHANGASMFFLAAYPHVPRHVLRLLQGAARGALDPRWSAAAHDHDRLHGLRAALGADELLGGDRHHQPVLGDPAGRRVDRQLAVGRLRGRQSRSTDSTRCTAAVRDRRRGGAAHLGCTWPGRTIPTASSRRPSTTRLRSRPTRRSRMPSSCWCSASCWPGSCSTSRTSSVTRTITSRPTRR